MHPMCVCVCVCACMCVCMCVCLLECLIPMLVEKSDEKGYFFPAGQCAALSSFKAGKWYFDGKRVGVTILIKCCDQG